jgi:hypothetical protein
MKTLRPLTPKEFSEAIGRLLSPDTIRAKCRSGEIATVSGPERPPYFIRPTELEKWRPTVARWIVAV